MIELLFKIKEQLFDAPSEIKEAFNTVVGYFDTKYTGKYSGKENGNNIIAVVGVESKSSNTEGKKLPYRFATLISISKSSLANKEDPEAARKECEDKIKEKGYKFIEFVGTFPTRYEADRAASKLKDSYKKFNEKQGW